MASVMPISPAIAVDVDDLQAQIEALLAQIVVLQAQLADMGGDPVVVQGCSISSFDRSLKKSMSGDDVKCLQIILNSASDTEVASSGVGSSGSETKYFGSLTYAAVVKFQEKYADDVLAVYGLTSGTGYVGTTTKAKLNELLAGGSGDPEDGPVSDGSNSVRLSSTSPVAAAVAKGAQDQVFAVINFSAGDEAYTVSSIAITRTGVSADTDLSNIKIYDGTVQLGSTQALNTTTHKASLLNLGWMIPANTVKTLTVKGSVATGASPGNSVVLGIASADDIVSSAVLSGSYPINSAPKSVATQVVGALAVDTLGTPSTSTPISGSVGSPGS